MSDDETEQVSRLVEEWTGPADLGEWVGIAASLAKVYEIHKLPQLKDPPKIRLGKMPAYALSATAHFLSGEFAAASLHATSILRSASRFTPWGEKYKKQILFAGLVFMGEVARSNYEGPIDALPPIAGLLGSTADYVSQGRYQRLWNFIASLPIFSYAVLEGNRSMAFYHGCTTYSALKGIRKQDIPGAAGKEGATFSEDFKAYAFGVLRNTATGADKRTMVDTNFTTTEEKENAERIIDENHLALLESERNPYFFGQDEAIERTRQALERLSL